MPETKTGADLFIVDNSDSDWKVRNYLREWTEISNEFDICTGYFEIGALLALDGEWQKVAKIRILMGDEVSRRTKSVLVLGITQRFDQSIETEKEKNDFLKGVPAILAALKSGQIECRVYSKKKFHAKAYITRSKLAVVGSSALVGSSNFTFPGLTDNVELNVQLRREVEELQDWFDKHWNDADDVSEEILKTIERHTREYSPFDVYAKALQEYFRGHQMTANEWDEARSKMFPILDRYQKEAYWALMKIARQHEGAFLCDGVGLGKTFVGLMLIERLILHEGKRVVLFAPKATKDGVWVPHLKDWLPHVGGVGGNADFSNLAVFSHTDLTRKGEFPERFRRIAELADVVIIDEAHHFRNPGRSGEKTGKEPSRYYQLYNLLDGSVRRKTVFLLTATPINNRISDFRHLAELFTRRDEAFFARTLGVNNFRAHFNQIEKNLNRTVGDAADVGEHLNEAQDLLTGDPVFQALVVQRSRAYAKESQMRETGNSAVFPDRKAPQVAAYSIRKTYGKLLDMFEKAFAQKNPLFTLPMYYPLFWYKGDDVEIDPFEQNRQKQVVGLIRTNFLKRFESSVAAFELSCNRLLRKLLAFVEVHSITDAEKRRLENWKTIHGEALGFAREMQMTLWGDDDDVSDEEDIVPQEFLDAVEVLDPEEYDIPEMLSETYVDLEQLVKFISEARNFQPKHDDKLQKLIRLLTSKELDGQKVLLFTEFADTARYLKKQLDAAGLAGVGEVDSGTKANRAEIIERFSPYYNRSSSRGVAEKGRQEIRVLISTDVLSEGLNLQDASRMINYDIHWNPVRLMQRIGRVDRRMDPATEARLIADHPEIEASRGKVSYWNFLPPDELNEILTLYTKVTQKTLLISKTLGIEGKKLLTPEDDYEALKEFNQAYEGTKTAVEDMHLEFQQMIQDDPGLLIRLDALPGAVFSGKGSSERGRKGVFFCYGLPALNKETGEFDEAAGSSGWYFLERGSGTIFAEPGEIVGNIRSSPDTPRSIAAEADDLSEARGTIEKYIKNVYLKRIQAPIGVKPKLKAWMEVS